MSNDNEKRILVVDDEPGVRLAMRHTLRSGGYKVEMLASPLEALEQLSTLKPHLIISDYLMPELTGLEFLCRARLRSPDSMRLLVTGHAETQVAIDAINRGEIFRFVTKPWDVQELLATIHGAFVQLAAETKRRKALTYARHLGAAWSADADGRQRFDQIVEKLRALEEEPDFLIEPALAGKKG